jgi:hypothetical protein
MFDISQGTANTIYGISNAALGVGALCVLLGTLGAIWSGGIRERYSDERIARNEARTAAANARAAEAELKVAEATLELTKFRAPRTLTVEQQAAITEKIRAFAGLRFDATVVRSDPETYQLLDMIEPALAAARWTQINWDNSDAVLQRRGKPNVGEWAATNVIIAVPHDLMPRLWSAAEMLASVLAAEGIPAQAQDAKGMTVKNNDVMHLLIGRKM